MADWLLLVAKCEGLRGLGTSFMEEELVQERLTHFPRLGNEGTCLEPGLSDANAHFSPSALCLLSAVTMAGDKDPRSMCGTLPAEESKWHSKETR